LVAMGLQLLAAPEKRDRFFQRHIAAFEAADDLFEFGERLFKAQRHDIGRLFGHDLPVGYNNFLLYIPFRAARERKSRAAHAGLRWRNDADPCLALPAAGSRAIIAVAARRWFRQNPAMDLQLFLALSAASYSAVII